MDTNAILRPPQLDDLGLPLGWEDNATNSDVSPEDMQRFVDGDFASLGLMARPPPTPTAEEVRKEARERATEIFEKWSELQQILERYEEGIRKRWMKKTKSQRTNIVLQAWPNMSSTHRPEFQALRREGPSIKTRGTYFREAYVWPYINVEDLVRGKTMLLFLNSRGRHAPYLFAKADFEPTGVGRVSQAIVPAFLNVHTMLLEGTTVETYGRLVAWEDDPDGMTKCLTGLGHIPGEGLLILEIQQRTLRFLVDCCYATLHDFDPVSMIKNAPIKPEPEPIVDKSEWSSLATIAAEAPYRLPSQINFLRLKTLAATKRSSTEDHIRALREDPGYFFDTVGDWSEHREERIPDSKRTQHPMLGKPLFWNRVIGAVVSDGYGALVVWHDISEQLSNLANLQAKYSNVINPRETLPGEYLKALLVLRYTLSQVQKGLISTLKQGLRASPYFRSSFFRDPNLRGSDNIRIRGQQNLDQLMWLFNALWTDDQLMLLGLPNIVDEIENIIHKDPKEKARLSSWVTRVFADLGLIAKFQLELERYQPWASGYIYEYNNYGDEIERDFPKRVAALAEVERGCKSVSFAELGEPGENRFYYPSDKRRTEETTNSMQRAERNLDLFWEKLDRDFQSKTGKTLDQIVEHIFTNERHLERTQAWIEPPKKSKNTSAQKSDAALYNPPSAGQLGGEGSKFVPPRPKVKSKTRGSAREILESPPQDNIIPPVDEPSEPKFVLKNRSFKVFKVLFYNPGQSDLPGDVAWNDFLFAMVTVGFAPEKLYGSIWQFTPTNLDVERSIQFHEPHPVAKISFRYARRIGRRLSRAYGWHGGIFTLE